MQLRELSMRSDQATDAGAGAGDAPGQRTPEIDGDTLLRDVDTPHLRNEVQRRLFGKVVDPIRIARFPVLRRVGQGGMGVVFAAFDNELDRKVAIKLLRPGLGDDGVELRDRLLREAKALARLSHPAIVQVYEAGEHDGQVYLAMEFVEGRTLRQWCEAERRSVRELLDKFLQAGEGLAAAHAAGLVHRDFKPDNVIVGDDGRVRVLDFGLAMLGNESPAAREDVAAESVALDRLTRTGAMLGTPAYMAPEQLLGEPADARSDQFSFAVTLFESLFGVRPFAGETLETLRAAVVKGEVTAPKARGDAVRVARALRRALLPDREARYADIRELLAALRATQRQRGIVIATFGALVAVGTGGVVLQQTSRDAEVASLAATVDSLGTEVQGERSRADDAEAQLRKRGDVLTLGEARFSARRDPSLALALLARLSDDDEAWGADTWSLAQRSAAGRTAEEIVPVPAGQVARSVVLDGRAVILQDSSTEGSTLWFPWEDRSVVLARGRHHSKRVDERTWIIQPGGSKDAVVWDLEVGAPIAPLLDVDVGWSILSEDRTTLVVRDGETWAALDLRTLAKQRVAIPSEKMLLSVGPGAEWFVSFDLERIDASGRVTSRLREGDEHGITTSESLGDGRFVRVQGRRMLVWSSLDGDARTLELAQAPAGMFVTRDGARIAVGGAEGRLLIVDSHTLERTELRPAASRVEPTAWLADDRLLFASTDNGGVLVDVESGHSVALEQGSEIRDVRLDGEDRLVSISPREVRRWRIDLDGHADPSGQGLAAIDGPAVDGTHVALRSGGELVRWRGGEWQAIGRHEGARSLSIAASGDVVVTAGRSGLVAWSLATGESRKLRDRLDEVALIEPPAVDASGRWVVVHAEKYLDVVDMRDGTSREIGGPGLLTHLSFAPDEPRFYVGATRGRDNALRRWDTETWQELPEVPLAGMLLAIGAGQRVAVRSREHVTIVELGTSGAPPTAMTLGFVTGARFSSDGRVLAGIAADGRVVLTDASSGRAGAVGPRLRTRERTFAELADSDSSLRADERSVVFSADTTRVLVLDASGALQRSRSLPPTTPAELRDWVRTNAPRLPATATLEELVPADDP